MTTLNNYLKFIFQMGLAIIFLSSNIAVYAEDPPVLLPVNESYYDTVPGGVMQYYQVDSAAYTKFKINLSSDYATMYVRQGALPTESEYDCLEDATYPDTVSCHVYFQPHVTNSSTVYIGVTGLPDLYELPLPSPECELDPSLPECEDPCFFDHADPACEDLMLEAFYQLHVEATGNVASSNQIENIAEPFTSLGHGGAEALADGDWKSYKISVDDKGTGDYSLSITFENQPYDGPTLGTDTFIQSDEVVLFAKGGMMPTENDYDCRVTLMGSNYCSINLQQSSLDVFVLVRYKDDPFVDDSYSLPAGGFRFTAYSFFQAKVLNTPPLIPILELLLE